MVNINIHEICSIDNLACRAEHREKNNFTPRKYQQ